MPFPLDETTKETIRQHFRRKKLVWEESYFIEMLKQPGSKYDVYMATIALRDCGSEQCIPLLKEKLYYPVQDVKCTALLTIAHLARERETEFYAQCLLDPKYREKTYAMWAINDAADHRAVNAVLEYLWKNSSKIRRGTLDRATLAHGKEYLERHLDTSPEVRSCLELIKEAGHDGATIAPFTRVLA